ncbi:MAG: lysine-sensitive aspartokinase 3, partial [Acidobacteriales bacterium]|nr:lysine-sensitive aspartokinase 3 [Terriglobales bacterium]
MIVMKFGGTSVEDAAAIERGAEIVRSRLPEHPVVVVSALAKVTDQLVAMSQAAGSGNRDEALALSRSARERHYAVAGELLGTGLFTRFHAELESDFDALDELLRGIAAVGELTPRSTDQVLSFGERISSEMVAEAFSARDIDAIHLDARDCIITDATHTKALPVFDETNARIHAQIRPLVQGKRVPVMGGFIGSTLSG